MTRAQAIRRAVERATVTRQYRYIIWSIEDADLPGQHYHVSTEDDLDGFYLGCTPELAVTPEGTIEA